MADNNENKLVDDWFNLLSLEHQADVLKTKIAKRKKIEADTDLQKTLGTSSTYQDGKIIWPLCVAFVVLATSLTTCKVTGDLSAYEVEKIKESKPAQSSGSVK